jgi:class 3 adenylate cyclase
MAIYSYRVISAGKNFTQTILEENKTFLVNTLRFGHGAMAHMGTESYESLIDLAMKSEFISYLAILDKKGVILAQSKPLVTLSIQEKYNPTNLSDEKIIEEREDLILISYEAKEIQMTEEHMKHHATFFKGRHGRIPPKPAWFLVALDTSTFKSHFRDMVIQSVGVGAAFLLIGILIIIFLEIIQRYELAHLSIEKLYKIKRLLDHFVPETAKNIIEKDPEKKGILDKYIQDASVLFLDIEGFTLLLEKYSQDRINRVIEYYFSLFLDVIQKNGGDINETAGDGMMVIFLDPDPVMHSRNAVKTGLGIYEQCQIDSETNDSEVFPIQVNVGIHSGEVYLGSTKMQAEESQRWTFTASGKVTIMAARLAQYAREGQILVGDETVQRTREYFEFIPLGVVSLKNIEDPGQIYQLSLPQS